MSERIKMSHTVLWSSNVSLQDGFGTETEKQAAFSLARKKSIVLTGVMPHPPTCLSSPYYKEVYSLVDHKTITKGFLQIQLIVLP